MAYSIDFEGDTGRAITPDSGIALTGDFTVTIDFTPTATGVLNHITGSTDGTTAGSHIEMTVVALGGNVGKILAYVGNYFGGGITLFSENTVTLDTQSQIIISRSGSTVSLTLDGGTAATGTFSSTLNFGRFGRSNAVGVNEFKLHNFSINNAGTTYSYPCNEGTGTTLSDENTNGPDFTLSGFTGSTYWVDEGGGSTITGTAAVTAQAASTSASGYIHGISGIGATDTIEPNSSSYADGYALEGVYAGRADDGVDTESLVIDTVFPDGTKVYFDTNSLTNIDSSADVELDYKAPDLYDTNPRLWGDNYTATLRSDYGTTVGPFSSGEVIGQEVANWIRTSEDLPFTVSTGDTIHCEFLFEAGTGNKGLFYLGYSGSSNRWQTQGTIGSLVDQTDSLSSGDATTTESVSTQYPTLRTVAFALTIKSGVTDQTLQYGMGPYSTTSGDDIKALAFRAWKNRATGSATYTKAVTVGGTVTGTAAVTAQAASTTATGKRVVTGASAVTAQAASTSGTGERVVTGAVAATAQAASTSASGVRVIPGSAAVAAQSSTVAATGERSVVGSASVTAQSAAVSATGERLITGSSAATAQVASVSASGERIVTGSAAVTAQSATTAATGERTITGTAAVTAQATSTVGVGAVGGAIVGSAAVTAQAVSVSASGVREVVGSSASAGQSATVSASGNREVVGSATVAAQAASASGSGTVTQAGTVTGTAAVTAQSSNVVAIGIREVVGSSASAGQSSTVTASGNVIKFHSGTAAVSSQFASVSASGTVTDPNAKTGTAAVTAQASNVVAIGYRKVTGLSTSSAGASVVSIIASRTPVLSSVRLKYTDPLAQLSYTYQSTRFVA